MFFAQDDYGFEIDFETPEAGLLRLYSTKHGFIRTLERTHLNYTRIPHFIRSAWLHGMEIDELPPKLRAKYAAQYVSLMFNGKSQIRIYRRYLFIFSPDGKLITMYPLDEEKNHDENERHRRKIQNIHRKSQLLNAYSHAEDYEDVYEDVSCYY